MPFFHPPPPALLPRAVLLASPLRPRALPPPSRSRPSRRSAYDVVPDNDGKGYYVVRYDVGKGYDVVPADDGKGHYAVPPEDGMRYDVVLSGGRNRCDVDLADDGKGHGVVIPDAGKVYDVVPSDGRTGYDAPRSHATISPGAR